MSWTGLGWAGASGRLLQEGTANSHGHVSINWEYKPVQRSPFVTFPVAPWRAVRVLVGQTLSQAPAMGALWKAGIQCSRPSISKES